MNFLRQDFQKVTSNRRIDRQTNRYDWNYIQKLYTRKLYTTPLRRWSNMPCGWR